MRKTIGFIGVMALCASFWSGCAECENDLQELEELEKELEKLDDEGKPKKAGASKKKGGKKGGGKCQDVSGTWAVTTRIDKRACDDGISTEKITVEISQKGCRATATLDGAVTLKGRVKGNNIRLTGSYDDLVGKVSKNINLTIQGKTLRGSGTWKYKVTGYKCAGTETFSGKKR